MSSLLSSQQYRSLRSAWPLAILLLALVVSNPWFAVFDDEAFIISVANLPDYLPALYLVPAHVHPPATDILLHFWLKVADGKVWLIRLPFILFYIMGIWCTAKAAELLGTHKSFTAVIWIATLWPFGFHHGRAAGWYTPSFLLVALLTWRYLAWRKSSAHSDLIILGIIALALIHTNLFGWAFLAVLFADHILFESRKPSLPFLATAAWMALAVFSFWHHWPRVFLGLKQSSSLVTGFLYGSYSLYTIHVSESVAPWYFFASIPAALVVAVSLGILFLKAPVVAKRYAIYFFVVLFLLAAVGAIGPKRLLFLSPWLLIALGLTASHLHGRIRAGFLTCLTLLFAVGTWGMIDRSHYSSFHWIEPWPEVSQTIVKRLDPDTRVLVSHWSALFYLYHALPSDQPQGQRFTISSPRLSQHGIHSTYEWDTLPKRKGRILLVRGSEDVAYTRVAMQLEQTCRFIGVERQLQDKGWELKRRFFPAASQPEWRVEIREYHCP